MKLLKNKFVIGIFCILAAFLISFVVLPQIQGSPTNKQSNTIRLKHTIEAGTQITAEMVEMVNIPENLKKDDIPDASAIVGRYANTRLYTGDFVTEEKISATLKEQNALAAGTEKGKMVVSVTLPSLASGVSGRLMPGDIVTVMALPKSPSNQSLGLEPEPSEKDASCAIIYPELQYVEVCMSVANDGANANVNADPAKDEKNSLPVTVSLYVNQAQAMKLAEMEQQSTIHLAFVARGKDASQYIPDAQRVLNTESNGNKSRG